MEMNGDNRIGRINRCAMACAALALVLTGCAMTPEEKAAAAARRAAPTAVVMTQQNAAATPAQEGLPKSRDGYPTFGGSLTAANVQMSDEQAANQQHELTSLTAARRAGTISEAEYQRRMEEMRRLATQHGPETLSEISR